VYTPQGRDTFFLLSGRTCMVPPEADSHKVTFGKGVERVDWLVRRLYLWSSEPDRVQSTYHGMCGGDTHSQQGEQVTCFWFIVLPCQRLEQKYVRISVCRERVLGEDKKIVLKDFPIAQE
jgi:hypothetical protein